ncbi:hypothetical protein BGZ74_006504, partial [Mortierella antarctica]
MTEHGRLGLEPRGVTSRKKYTYVARIIHKIFSRFMDPQKTTLHVDGKPSIQKSEERKRRQADNDRLVASLEREINQIINRNGDIPHRQYDRLLRAYRLPPEAVEEILTELEQQGWTICHCDYQADTHIAAIAQESKSEIGVVSGDSDLL